jgi:hypothetical protein
VSSGLTKKRHGAPKSGEMKPESIFGVYRKPGAFESRVWNFGVPVASPSRGAKNLGQIDFIAPENDLLLFKTDLTLT